MITRIVTTALAALATGGTMAISTASPAGAATNQLHVTAAGTPAWVAHEALPVAVTVDNPDAPLFCSPVEVTITWHASDGVEHLHTVSEVAAAGAWAGTVRIPARFVRRGALRYTVSASQECGLFTAANVYGGHLRGTLTSHVV